MKKKLIIIFLMFALSSICFAQGFSIPCDVIYPVESCKNSFILENKTVKIADDSRTEVVLTVTNRNQTSESLFTYINYYGATSRSMKADDITVYINGKQVKTFKEAYSEGENFLFTGSVPKGTFKIKCIMNAGGREISGTSYIEIYNDFIKNWNVSESYTEEIYVSMYNDIISFDRKDGTLEFAGKGKQKGDSFFLTSGYVKFTTKNKNSFVTVWKRNYKNGSGGGFGAPTLPSSYDRDKKVYYATDYITQFITAARIVSNEVKGYEYSHDNYKDLIEYLNLATKEELRLFRNAFYAKNGFVFKDPELNKFFDDSICYIPNNTLKQDSIKKTEEEKILIEMIQAAEQGKQPEDVINSYRK